MSTFVLQTMTRCSNWITLKTALHGIARRKLGAGILPQQTAWLVGYLPRSQDTMEDQSFSGKIVVITGAGAGIGRATALRFARSGANIAGWDVSDKAAAAFETDISAAGGQALFQMVNVVDPTAVDAAVSKVVEKWGGIDVLINNAGIVRDAQLVKKNGAGPMKGMLRSEERR